MVLNELQENWLLNLPATQTHRLPLVLHSAARAVTKTLKFHHITPILKSLDLHLHWLKIKERLKYKVLSHTYKSLKTGQTSYHRSLPSFPSHRCTRSSSPTLSHISLNSRLKIANRSRYHYASVLGNSLPFDLRHVAHHFTPLPILNSPISDLSTAIFLKMFQTIFFTLHFLLIVCIHL